MTGKYISFEPELVETVANLRDCPSEFYTSVFQNSVTTLEGGLDRERVSQISQTAKFDVQILLKVVQAASILLWEVTKGLPPKDDLSTINTALRRMGWSGQISQAFCDTFKEHRLRLNKLKGALAISKRRYKDFVWRLDVELARRNMSVITQPKFMIRLDVYDAREGTSGKGEEVSLHLQADYANLKHMQQELQHAIDDLNSKHGQRITRYIK
jgi:hypothetical protein